MLSALVTGGSRGLGREIVIALNNAGFNVSFSYLSSDKEALELASKAEGIMAVRADAGDLKQMEDMADAVRKRFGGVDLIVNNAGIAKNSLLIKCSEDDWDEVIRVNLKGAFNTARVFAPLMAESGGGHIINISSYSGLRGKAGQAAYSASKAALIGMTYSLAKELAEYNIKVNCLLPGYMPTDMGRGSGDAMGRAMEESVLKTLSDPKDVAGFIVYLASTKNVTGQVFNLDSRI